MWAWLALLAHALDARPAAQRPVRRPMRDQPRRALLGRAGGALLGGVCGCALCAAPPAHARENARFAAAMAMTTASYERALAPRKASLFARLPAPREPSPLIVELGIGTAPNLVYYPPWAAGARIVGVEPNAAMWAYARGAAEAAGLQLELLDASAEALPLPSASVDLVVCTLVLCSVPSQARALAEARRVLKKGGRLLFCEHVAAERDAGLAAQQRVLDGLQGLLADGCHVTRRTRETIEAAGFERVDADDFDVLGHWLITPHTAGIAVA
jgi:SAM-dependent methyltransferase